MKIAVLRARIYELEEALANLTLCADTLASVVSSIAGTSEVVKDAVWAYRTAKEGINA